MAADNSTGLGRIRRTFATLARARRKALIPFVMAGDPNLAATESLILALEDAGADLIEVGVPFSDPLADGPTIQRASTRALAAGTTPERVLAMLGRVSRRVHVPLVVLSYWNPIAQFRGHTLFGKKYVSPETPMAWLKAAKRAGVSGVVIPDLSIEEAGGFARAASQAGIAAVLLAAPTSPHERLRRIAKLSRGFIYYVSVTGTTGARRTLSSDWAHGVRQLKLVTTTPVCVGFGISTPAQAAAVARSADGVIIGSALIQQMEPYRRQPRLLSQRVGDWLRTIRVVL